MADYYSLNKVILVGHIASDIHYDERKGKKYAFFMFATNEYFKVKGKVRKRSEMNPVVAWGFRAKVIKQYGKRGTCLAIEGKLRARIYIDSKGKPRHRSEVHAEQVIFMPRKTEKKESEKQLVIEEVPEDENEKKEDPF